jgi:Holliday junction DNA helicase RuvB
MNTNLDAENDNFKLYREESLKEHLRPLSFDDFTGQAQVLENLKVFVKAAEQRGEALDHVLLHGPPGLGKTTLANIIANELKVGFKVTSGPVLEKTRRFSRLVNQFRTRRCVVY